MKFVSNSGKLWNIQDFSCGSELRYDLQIIRFHA